MRRLILLTALTLTACPFPLPYCPPRLPPPAAHKPKTPATAQLAKQRAAREHKAQRGRLLHIQNECLATQNNTLVRQPCRQTANQYFEHSPYEGIIKQRNQCLTHTGGRITLAPCTGEPEQRWYSDGNRLCSHAVSGCWDAAGRIVRLQPRSDSPTQEVLR